MITAGGAWATAAHERQCWWPMSDYHHGVAGDALAAFGYDTDDFVERLVLSADDLTDASTMNHQARAAAAAADHPHNCKFEPVDAVVVALMAVDCSMVAICLVQAHVLWQHAGNWWPPVFCCLL